MLSIAVGTALAFYWTVVQGCSTKSRSENCCRPHYPYVLLKWDTTGAPGYTVGAQRMGLAQHSAPSD